MMTVRDLLPMEVDIDVYDDVTEELGIAFCGPARLTEEGERHFAEVLEYPVTLESGEYEDGVYAIVHVDDDNDKIWKRRLRMAKELFEGLAGYCTVDEYRNWFGEEV